MDLALNNPQKLICHKPNQRHKQRNKQTIKQHFFLFPKEKDSEFTINQIIENKNASYLLNSTSYQKPFVEEKGQNVYFILD